MGKRALLTLVAKACRGQGWAATAPQMRSVLIKRDFFFKFQIVVLIEEIHSTLEKAENSCVALL